MIEPSELFLRAYHAINSSDMERGFALSCNKNGRVYLGLCSRDRVFKKCIGRVMDDGLGLLIYLKDGLNKEEHYLHKKGGWGVNALMAGIVARLDGIIIYSTEFETHQVSGKVANSCKDIEYRSKFCERQKFVPGHLWTVRRSDEK